MNTPTIYTVRLTREAEQELRRLPQQVIRRIDAILEGLRQNPRPRELLNPQDRKIHIGE